ncbi:phage tail protein [Shewanella sp. D64]|uniref:phage tail protein n=1 Tax=unclassified Shewanella TaxID=196818 RepID=UPI0022BA556F|nr:MULTISPECIES: phage tail protein [unclassified Shewanella]MEC4725848.1 phage tail protein [Shewanella sp. D64]MEC4737103.1 phage tail protein [Shewanella sp. E94]WBJ95705.1 phage tail protein [Shewanella sp. MTB7]
MSHHSDNQGIGRMHKAITAAVLQFLPSNLHHLVESWMQPSSIALAAKDTGVGIELGWMTYTTTIRIENVPFKLIDTASLFAQVSAWLIEHDNERTRLGSDESQILIDTEKVDDDTIDIDIDVMFCELISMVGDASGSIAFDGQHYALTTPIFRVADSIDITVGTTDD